MVAQRQELANALIACAQGPSRAKTRRFVNGLSSDELQFIAAYLGASILESARQFRRSRADLAARVAEFQAASAHTADADHKMILLLEFLWRTGAQDVAPASAGSC